MELKLYGMVPIFCWIFSKSEIQQFREYPDIKVKWYFLSFIFVRAATLKLIIIGMTKM